MMIGGGRNLAGRLALIVTCFVWVARAQEGIDFDKVGVQTVQIADGIYVLVGGHPAVGNIGVSVGTDGILVVDSMYAPLHQKILDALAKISRGPIRFVINTHNHVDHTGGNELMSKMGAVIIGHENLRKRMVSQQANPDQQNTPASTAALPILTYRDSLTLHFNGEEIYVYHPDAAHTDGDSVVYFRRANVMHVGDLPSSLRYPNIGVDDGGSVNGMIAGVEQILKIANPDTKIIPGHIGTAVSVTELQQQRDMFMVVRDRVLRQIRMGKTLEQVIASKPTAEFDESRRKGVITPDRFAELVYRDLSSRNP